MSRKKYKKSHFSQSGILDNNIIPREERLGNDRKGIKSIVLAKERN